MRFAIFMFCLASLPPGILAQQAVAPSLKPSAIKLVELGRVSNMALGKAMESFWKTQSCHSDQVYIISYGSDREIARREKIIINKNDLRRCFDRSRTTLIRGGFGNGPRTVIWSIPLGADNPSP
jgi:hypothetical protein